MSRTTLVLVTALIATGIGGMAYYTWSLISMQVFFGSLSAIVWMLGATVALVGLAFLAFFAWSSTLSTIRDDKRSKLAEAAMAVMALVVTLVFCTAFMVALNVWAGPGVRETFAKVSSFALPHGNLFVGGGRAGVTYLTTIVLIVAGCLIAIIAHKRGHVVKPSGTSASSRGGHSAATAEARSEGRIPRRVSSNDEDVESLLGKHSSLV